MLTLEEITTETIQKEPSTLIDLRVKRKLCQQLEEKGQVIIHCSLILSSFSRIRIWKTTYLYDKGSEFKSQLLHAEGISIYPADWTLLPGRSDANFTLIFSGLPRQCKVFDLLEQTQGDPGSFSAKSIIRNKSDVYYVQLQY